MNAWKRTALAALAAAAMATGGCDGFAKMIGAPTSQDYKALEKQAEESAKALDEAEDARAALQVEFDKAEKAKAASESRVASLKAAQSEIAQQLAAADGDLRDALTSAMRRIDRDIEAERSTAVAIGATLAEAEERIGQLAVERERATRRLDEALEQVDLLDAKGKAAIAGALEGIKGLGQTASSLGAPGAGAIANTVADGLGGLLVGLIPTAGIALNYRRQRNGARRVIANTERFGMEQIAKDPAVRSAAKAAMAADPAAKKEYALAKAAA